MLGVCWGAGPAWAEEPIARIDSEVAAQLAALDDADAQLAEAETQLEAATTRQARRALKATIHDLKATQDRLLRELEEALLGPRPAVVLDEPATDFEEQLDARQRRHEAILESNVEFQLPID